MHLRAFWPLLLAYLLAGPAGAQTSPIEISHVENPDGTVAVFAENSGFVVVTVYLSAELVNMSSSVSLPAKVAVFPAKGKQVLTTFTRQKTYGPFSYCYHAPSYPGLYSSQRPDTTYAYRLPFKAGTTWSWGLYDKRSGKFRFPRHSFVFALPDSTPVCAARPGIVFYFQQDVRQNTQKHSNFAAYSNLTYRSVAIALGQRVNAGQLIAYSSAGKSRRPLWFSVGRLGAHGPEEVPILCESGNKPASQP
jgi:murein DD-endopeptidase MepM/ murein hydrolase activator NlpD